MRFMFALLLLFAGCVPDCYADYLDYHFRISCDSAHDHAEIVPYAVADTDVYSIAPQNCVFNNGRSIRVKMGLGPVYPYGMGGADPSKWLSVWLDKALVLSRINFGCVDEGPCALRIVVNAKGINVCLGGEAESPSQQESSKKSKEQCEFTPNEKLSTTRDALEFPAPDERQRPSAGSLATLFARDAQFCNSFQLLSESRGRGFDNIWPYVGFPEGAKAIEPEASSLHEFSGDYAKYIFDINNDGKKETVIGLHSRNHYRDGDVYFVYSNNKVPIPSINGPESPRSESGYAKSAMRILPQYWSDYAGTDERQLADNDTDEGSYTAKNAASPWWDIDDEPIFRFRYWYLWPFRYKKSTYFLTWSQERGKQHWYTVLRPEPDYRVTEMCIFQTVQVRY